MNAACSFPSPLCQQHSSMASGLPLVMEVAADPEDIMSTPGSEPVLRRHFERRIGTKGPQASY
jgi:hypothetical protein